LDLYTSKWVRKSAASLLLHFLHQESHVTFPNYVCPHHRRQQMLPAIVFNFWQVSLIMKKF